jgi:Domain of unknown function (DUF4913)
VTPRPPDEDESAEDIRRDEESVARQAELYYGNVNEFVTDRFVHLYPLPGPASTLVWCPEWFAHAPALSRLDSIWRAWERLRFDPVLGMSNWWLHHVDPHMRVLLDPVDGPFARCGNGHVSNEPLPVAEPPAGLFTDQRSTWLQTGDPFALD